MKIIAIELAAQIRSAGRSRRPAAALMLLLAACRPAGRSEPAPPTASLEAPPSATPTTPPVTPPATPTGACEDPATVFAGFAWLPGKAQALVSVHLKDRELPLSLDTLDDLARGPLIRDSFGTDFSGEYRDLRAFLIAAKLSPDEAIYFAAGPDVGVWAVPGSCEPDGFARLAAALGLEVRSAPGPSSITFATGPAPNRYALVHRPAGGPLWITGADQLGPLLAWLDGWIDAGAGSWAACEQAFRLNQPDAPVRVFLLADPSIVRQHSISGTSLVTSNHISCAASPAPRAE